MEVKWAVGMTTVPERRATTLPRTLASVRTAGFSALRLFVDGDEDAKSWAAEFGADVTCRYPRVRAWNNWLLALYELFMREPHADRYLMLQDDFVTGLGLREYLERTLEEYPVQKQHRNNRDRNAQRVSGATSPQKVYWNLYSFPSNEALAEQTGWFASNQQGRGAVGLMFDGPGVEALLVAQRLVQRAQHQGPGEKGYKNIDGAVVTTLKYHGYVELTHSPSLVQHIGDVSAIGNNPHKRAGTFRGEAFDYRSLP